jgi:hypothetical protein
MSTTLRLVFDETLFDRERNLLKRITQIDIKTTIRVMTTRTKMKIETTQKRAINNHRKEEYSTIVIIALLENSSDDRIRDL